ncbi:MAG: hypothetical protein M3Q44_03705 [bacterium]|nr:hypothetical protein [bacterium]
MATIETELGQIGHSKRVQELIPAPINVSRAEDDRLWQEFGGQKDKWKDGLYHGNIEDPQDRRVVAQLINANELIVACFGNVTYGIIGDGYVQNVSEQFRDAKNAPKQKPLSALIHPNSLPLVIDPKAVGGTYSILSNPDEFGQRFTSLAFVKAGIKRTLVARYIAPHCFRQEEIFNGKPYSTANMLTFVGDGASGELQSEVANVIASKHNRKPESVWIPVSSCNLSGRGFTDKKSPDHFEIVHESAAEEFCRQAGIKAVLHSPLANQYRSASFEMWAVTPDGVYREREGNIRFGHIRRLFSDIPFDYVNAKATIKRNRQLIGSDIEVAKLLRDGTHEPREVGSLLRAYYANGSQVFDSEMRRLQTS